MSLKDIPEIIKQFDIRQRLVVLILILTFSSVTALGVTYLRGSDCAPIIKQNKELIKDYAEIVGLLRAELYPNREPASVDSVMAPPTESSPPEPKSSAPTDEEGYGDEQSENLQKALSIAEKHTTK